MAVTVRASGLAEISPLRTLYREETNCQIIHGSVRVRPGWTREFALAQEDGTLIGYGSVAVSGPLREYPRSTNSSSPANSARTFELFATLPPVCGARIIDTQSNEPILPVLLHTFTRNIRAQSILFEDAIQTARQPRANRQEPPFALSPPTTGNSSANANWMTAPAGSSPRTARSPVTCPPGPLAVYTFLA